ncbi:hypothetical protein HAX54_004930, partial [Datura stramonium]|nr:hypothetical protein [Datura stramonium]
QRCIQLPTPRPYLYGWELKRKVSLINAVLRSILGLLLCVEPCKSMRLYRLFSKSLAGPALAANELAPYVPLRSLLRLGLAITTFFPFDAMTPTNQKSIILED